MYELTVHTPPAIEPISLAEAKNWLRVDNDADDSLIETMITSARMAAENYTNRKFITQTLKQDFQAGAVIVPLNAGPVQGDPILVIGSTDLEVDVDYTFNESTYAFQLNQMTTAKLSLTYVVGYGDSADDVPAPIKQAILLTMGKFYENRSDQVHRLPTAAQHLLNGYRLWIT
ncbi:MAG: head-tail connector protein [Bacteroidota bacterium]